MHPYTADTLIVQRFDDNELSVSGMHQVGIVPERRKNFDRRAVEREGYLRFRRLW